jgi:probable HAF family extracellular repeat protein
MTPPSSTVVWLAFLAVFPFAVSAAGGAAMYAVTDLGTLPGFASSRPTGINNAGQVIGRSWTDGSLAPVNHAFLYSGGQMIDLGVLGSPPGLTSSIPAGINDNGDVVGYSYLNSVPPRNYCPFLYTQGYLDDISIVGATMAFGINDSGQIVGSGVNGHAFVYNAYTGGRATDLGTLGGSESIAFGISGNGQVVGSAYTANGDEHAFLFSGGAMQDLGTLLGGTFSRAYAVNNVGQAVGIAYGPNGTGIQHAFLYSGGQMQDLGTFGGIGSCANWINNAGQVVGYAGVLSGPPHAFLYSGGVMIDLSALIDPSSGWTIEGADAINDEGQIVGDGINPAGADDAFLLTPIPEPATLTILVLGGLVMNRRQT